MERSLPIRWANATALVGAGALLLFLINGMAWAEPRVLGMRHWSAPSCTRVVVDLSDEVTFRALPSSPSTQLVLEFQGTIQGRGDQTLNIQDGLVKQASLNQQRRGSVRLLLELKGSGMKHSEFVLPKVDGRPFRLVVDVENQDAGHRMQEERLAVQKEKAGKTRVIVIDAGHGGEDPGALGARGTMEKDVVLAIARALQNRLSQSAGTRAFLTRNGDYFLGLKQRVEIAKDYGADLFISIHADASQNRSTRGASVYCLSLSGATDEASKILAEKENASDLMGGLKLSADRNLNTILVDLLQTQTINDGLKCGDMVLKSLEKVQEIKFSTPRQAGFRVLKAPDIPSVLVEVGFVTHPEEERSLNSSEFQDRIARALEVAAHRFLGQEGVLRTASLAQDFRTKPKPKTHVVQAGQNLTMIASQYHTSIRELRSLNDLKDASHIRPGQKILVP